MISAALADEIEEKMRPVGQVVKTEASHAFNIGSNPVRVTTSFLKREILLTLWRGSAIIQRSQAKAFDIKVA